MPSEVLLGIPDSIMGCQLRENIVRYGDTLLAVKSARRQAGISNHPAAIQFMAAQAPETPLRGSSQVS